jgi:hypothetical protein
MTAELHALQHTLSMNTQRIEQSVIAQLHQILETITAPLREGPLRIRRDLSVTLPVVRGQVLAVVLRHADATQQPLDG